MTQTAEKPKTEKKSGVLDLPTPRTLIPLLRAARYKGAYGGRGSGKSHFFAECAVERCLMKPGSRIVCVREVQRSLKESVKLLIEDKIRALKVGPRFNVLHDRIEAQGSGLIIFQGMQDHTAESVKSLEGFHVAYCEEAQTLTDRSLELLRPTIREPGSELWFSWNPRSADDAVDRLLRGADPPPDSICVRTNWRDNPWFPAELEAERQFDEAKNPLRYGHIWEGEYEPQAIGAIWNRQNIEDNRRDEAPALGRIVVGVDPAVSSTERSDETGIVVCGIGRDDGRGYVLDDMSCRGSPQEWAERAVAAYDLYEADAVIAEVNQGGEMVSRVIRSVRPNLRVIEARATRGKHLRAEPISALYGLGRVSHIGSFPKLEAQMCLMTAAGWEGDGSPDRVDALVYAMTNLFPALTRPKRDKSRPLPSKANSRYDAHRPWAR